MTDVVAEQVSMLSRIQRTELVAEQVTLLVRTNIDPQPPGGVPPFAGFAHSFINYGIEDAT